MYYTVDWYPINFIFSLYNVHVALDVLILSPNDLVMKAIEVYKSELTERYSSGPASLSSVAEEDEGGEREEVKPASVKEEEEEEEDNGDTKKQSSLEVNHFFILFFFQHIHAHELGFHTGGGRNPPYSKSPLK